MGCGWDGIGKNLVKRWRIYRKWKAILDKSCHYPITQRIGLNILFSMVRAPFVKMQSLYRKHKIGRHYRIRYHSSDNIDMISDLVYQFNHIYHIKINYCVDKIALCFKIKSDSFSIFTFYYWICIIITNNH